jgi:hypothetical protein
MPLHMLDTNPMWNSSGTWLTAAEHVFIIGSRLAAVSDEMARLALLGIVELAPSSGCWKSLA